MEVEVEKKTKYCRLCFKSCTNDFEVNVATEELLEKLLLLKPSLSLPEDAMVCKSCTENITKCFEIKTSYLQIEDCIDSFAKERKNINLDLLEIYLYKNDIKNKDNIPYDHVICRLCIKLAKCDSCISLQAEIKDATSLNILLSKYFPELNLNIIGDPKICKHCYESLERYFDFVEKVLVTANEVEETNLLKYEKAYPDFDIARRSFKDEDSVIKSEEGCSDGKDILVETIKREEVEIKIEQPDNRNQQDPLAATAMFHCDQCGYKSKHRYGINRHMLIHQDAAKIRMYECEVCKYRTKHKHTLRNHVQIHLDASQATIYRCDSCEYQTRHKSALNNHMVVHQETAEATVYQCEVCGVKSRHKYNMRRHMELHQNPSAAKMYHCQACDFKTRHKGGLKKHEVIHRASSEVNMYQCALCDYKTKYKGGLKCHMVIHEDPSKRTQYQCEQCKYKSKRKAGLKKHVLFTHNNLSGSTWYRCEGCKFKTKYKYCFDQHMDTHRGTSEGKAENTTITNMY